MKNCSICGSSDHRSQITTLPYILFGRGCEVQQCLNCGVGFTYPPPQVDSEYYSGLTHYEDRFDKEKELYRGFANDLLDFLFVQLQKRDIAENGLNLLDVGSGRGWLVEQAKLRGVNAYGIELNRNNVALAQAANIPLFLSIEDIYKSQSRIVKFDVIVFSAVLEHVNDPLLFINTLLQEVKPGGLVIASQAVYDGLLPRVAPWLWYGWQPNEHFFHFNCSALRGLFERSGLIEIQIERNSLHHRFSIFPSWKRLFGKNIATAIAKFGNAIGMGDQIFIAGCLPFDDA